MLKSTLLIFIFLFMHFAYGQSNANHLKIEGTVLGYTYDDSKILFKKDKKVELEGSLPNVSIKISDSKKQNVETLITNDGGEFECWLGLGEKYLLTYSKQGYGESAIEIDLLNIPEEVAENGLVLRNIELILNSFESNKPQDNGEAFGTIYFLSSKKQFEFKIHEFEVKKRLFKKNEDNTSINLMQHSLEKNVGLSIVQSDKGEGSKKRTATNSDEQDNVNELDKNVFTNQSSPISDLAIDLKKVDQDDLDQFGQKIKNARELLELDRQNAVTEMDYLKIAAREKNLENAERELANAKMFMLEQENKIKAQRNFIYAIIVVLLLLIAAGVLVWFAYRNKKRMNTELAVKNKKITDSIDYAFKIQNSVLLSDNQIKKIVPKSCLYYKPLEAVSGDFYWFSKLNDKVIVAAVDCTGHGVPGAFMSLIGNTLLNQIVNEKEIEEPAEILKALHYGVVESLHQNEAEDMAQDGMDMSVCSIDMKKGKLTFSGAMNPVYLVQKNEVVSLSGSLQTIGGIIRKNKEARFNQEEVDVEPGDRVYLFSDGFMDQFGGESNEKYNIPRFKELLAKLADVPMEKQEDALNADFEKWRGLSPQVDDILVIGVEI